MNNSTNTTEARRSVNPLRLIPASLIALLCATAIPFAFNTAMAIIVCVVGSATVLLTAKKKISAGLLLLIPFCLFGISSGLPMIAIILALIVGTGTLAWLIGYTSSPYVAIIPVLAFSITTIITKNYAGALLTLTFVPSALALALSFKKSSGRMSSLARAGLLFSATAIVAILGCQKYFIGDIDVHEMRLFAMDFTQSLADVFSSIEIETPQGAVPYLNEKNAYNIALQMVTLFPALAIIFFNAISFFAQKLQYSLIRLTEGEEKLTPKARALIVSPFAGVTFLLAFIVSSLTQSTVSGYAISTVCDNVILILMPCLIIMGFMYYVSARTFGRKRLSTALLILFVLLSFLNISLALLLVACVGAYASVSLPIITHINAKHNGE
jgi:hypothetical protein